jgi:hypothetical protein
MARMLLTLWATADEFIGPEQQMESELYLWARREWDERYGNPVLGRWGRQSW